MFGLRNNVTLVFFFFRPTGRLDEYLACIAKIQKAVEYFQDNNPDSPELNTVVQFNSHQLGLSDSGFAQAAAFK